MSTDLYCLRCVRCLWSYTGTEPRALARSMGEHRCDPADEQSLAAFRAAAAWLQRLNEGDK